MKQFKTMICLAIFLTGCQATNILSEKAIDSHLKNIGNSEDTLYEQIGTMEGIKHIVEDFINELLQDKRIARHFVDADLDNFHDKLVEQLCQISAGPCLYSGKAMKKIHADLKIDEAQFNAVVEAMMAAMDNNKIPTTVQNQLLALLVPMHKDIVTK